MKRKEKERKGKKRKETKRKEKKGKEKKIIEKNTKFIDLLDSCQYLIAWVTWYIPRLAFVFCPLYW